MAKQTKKNQAPYTDNPTPGHPDWNLAGKPSNDLAVKSLNKKKTKRS